MIIISIENRLFIRNMMIDLFKLEKTVQAEIHVHRPPTLKQLKNPQNR